MWSYNLNWQIRNVSSTFPQVLSAQNLVECWLRVRGSHLPSHMFLWSCGLVMPRGKTKTLYLHFHKTYKDQTWYSGYLSWRAPTPKVTWPLIEWSHGVPWQIINVLSLLPQDLLATNWVECWQWWRALTYHVSLMSPL